MAVGDLDGAAAACDELEATAADFRSRMLETATVHARGMVRVAADEPEAALPLLRRALEQWHQLDLPYEAAHAHVLIGRASRALGDEEGALSEWTAAGEIFSDLGARPDLERVARLTVANEDRDPHGLSARQLEVLRHVAAGSTNREIADALVISHRTVERHVSDIFTKLDVSSRAAATAYAYEHDLA